MKLELSRRQFLQTGSASAVALTVGFQLTPRGAHANNPVTNGAVMNAWLTIHEDNTVTLISPAAEMGQGSETAVPALIAEELELEWDQIRVAQAPAHEVYNNRMMNFQGTGGSTAIRWTFEPMRQVGANTRELLQRAAADYWGVDVSECSAKAAHVHHEATGRSMPYSELGALALDVPPLEDDVPLKPRSEWRLIGRDIKRFDSAAKSTGEATFGIDSEVPDMLIATMMSCPTFGGSLRSVDPAPAMAIDGVERVVQLEDRVAVLARDYWTAKRGLDALAPEWDRGPNARWSTQSIGEHLHSLLANPGIGDRTEGDIEAAQARAATTVTSTYEAPFLSHAALEPMNATAHVYDGGAEFWVSTQGPGTAHAAAAEMLGLPLDAIKFHQQYIGGGFGRRGMPPEIELQAAMLSKEAGRPVKLIWSREQDFSDDYYRPASVTRLEAYLDDAGELLGIRGRTAVPSIMRSIWDPNAAVDNTAMEGIVDEDYHFDAAAFDYHLPDVGVPVGFWRSVGHSQNTFFRESFIDEIAHSGGQDPVALRRKLLAGDERRLRVLDRVVEAGNWGSPGSGNVQGIAMCEAFGSIVAELVEARVQDDGAIDLVKITCAVEVGVAINTDTIRAQLEGAMVWGLTAGVYDKIDIENGAVVQKNFNEYDMVRLAHMPPVETIILATADGPGGVGEPGVPPVMPALTNAIFAATGQRIRKLPLIDQGFRLT